MGAARRPQLKANLEAQAGKPSLGAKGASSRLTATNRTPMPAELRNLRLAALLILAGLPGSLDAQGIKGRVIVTGTIPIPAALGPGRDACCQEAAPVDLSLRVGEGGGLAGGLVSVEPRRGEPRPPQGDPPSETVLLTNRGCAFEPRVLIVRTGQPLTLTNADPTMHNVNIGFVRNPAVNVVVAPQGRREFALRQPERKPIAVRCNVHTFMRGWVLVREDQHAAVTDESGRFVLPELPAGEWRLRFWHEGRGLSGLTIGTAETDKRGEVVVSVPTDGLDLGEIQVAVEAIRPQP